MLGAARRGLEPLARALAVPFVWLGVPPTALTLATLLPAAAAAALAADRRWGWALAVGVLAGLFDFLDGAVARARGRVTAFGGFLDSLVDRVVDLLFLFGLGFALDTREGWLVVTLGAIGTVGTPYARARAYEAGPVPAGSWNQFFERPERLLWLGLAGAVQGVLAWRGLDPDLRALHYFLVAFAAASLLTVVQRVLRVRRILGAAR